MHEDVLRAWSRRITGRVKDRGTGGRRDIVRRFSEVDAVDIARSVVYEAELVCTIRRIEDEFDVETLLVNGYTSANASERKAR